MRIIAGTARSRIIQAPDGMDTRPTLDRVRENLFNILQQHVAGASVLDLFGGSGALALEAVSRGAFSAVIVDHDPKAIRCVRANTESLRFDDRVRIIQADWQAAVRRLQEEKAVFDLVFLDPPYAMTDLSKVTESLLPLAGSGTVFIIEHDLRAEPVLCDALTVTDRRRYGIAGITFCRLKEEA